MEPILSECLSSFTNLTKLDIAWSTTSDCIPFFTHIGISCPKLKYLALSFNYHLTLEKDQVLALVLGNRAELLSQPIKDKMFGDGSNLQHIQFTQITPICHSLEHLNVALEGSNFTCNNSISTLGSRTLPAACRPVVFPLRHMSKLEGHIQDNVLNAIELLFEASQTTGTVLESEVVDQSSNKLDWKINAPSSSKLVPV